MVVASGQYPYLFESPSPFRGQWGFSGIHLEEAQFVASAEIRKFYNPGTYDLLTNDIYHVYTHPSITPSGYEPKPDGSTLGGCVGPRALFALDNIVEMRNVLTDGIFPGYAGQTEYTTAQHLTDWIRSAFPESPSGKITNGTFLRPVLTPGFPAAITGDITTTDLHWLGGSGVIMDIDVGEVMFNPYPWINQLLSSTIHERGVNWNIVYSPAWPLFQRTNGSLISLNGREPERVELPQFSYDHISSGYIRLDGYMFLDDTDFMLGQSAADFVAGQFNNISIVPRTLSTTSVELGNARAYLEPTPQSSGIYRICARTNKTNHPTAGIASGVVSQWPPQTSVNSRGYEVFDDALWITDYVDGVSGQDHPSSGLTVVSPFTGNALWQRFAEHTGIPDAATYWGAGCGLERPSADVIYRCSTSGKLSSLGPGTLIEYIMEFDDSLDFTQAHLVESAALGTQAYETLDYCYDGTNHYVLVRNQTNQNPGMMIFDGSFTYTDQRFFGLNTGVEHIGYANSTLMSYGPNSVGGGSVHSRFDTIVSFTIPPTGTPTLGTEKIVEKPAIFNANGSDTRIYDVIQVTGATHLEDGTYALVGRFFGFGSSVQLFIFHIEEQPTEYTLKAYWTTSLRAENSTEKVQFLYKNID